jgi:hypothetical protein
MNIQSQNARSKNDNNCQAKAEKLRNMIFPFSIFVCRDEFDSLPLMASLFEYWLTFSFYQILFVCTTLPLKARAIEEGRRPSISAD